MRNSPRLTPNRFPLQSPQKHYVPAAWPLFRVYRADQKESPARRALFAERSPCLVDEQDGERLETKLQSEIDAIYLFIASDHPAK